VTKILGELRIFRASEGVQEIYGGGLLELGEKGFFWGRKTNGYHWTGSSFLTSVVWVFFGLLGKREANGKERKSGERNENRGGGLVKPVRKNKHEEDGSSWGVERGCGRGVKGGVVEKSLGGTKVKPGKGSSMDCYI